MDNTKIIHTREIFNLRGTEKLPLGGVGTGHVSTKTLKAWVLENLAKDLQVDNINNTLDKDKPLSKSQRLYIDGSVSSFLAEITSLQAQLNLLEDKFIQIQEELHTLKNQ